ncbi:MAG: YkoF family thiamine/hydroxymethylpyrimidine-binding protein [Steroidobacteraceae bacterium]
MRTAVEISLYPLDRDYVPPIKEFIDRLHRHPGLTVVTNAMSTQVAGEHAALFAALAQETRTTFAAEHRAVFVMKVLGGQPTSDER